MSIAVKRRTAGAVFTGTAVAPLAFTTTPGASAHTRQTTRVLNLVARLP